MPENLGSIRKGGPDIKKWLGVKQQNELDKMKLCLVPKNAKDGAHFTDKEVLDDSKDEATSTKLRSDPRPEHKHNRN
ncbi:UNVERIFIED_CONTAM: hypothetical protein K2H54_005892 [Gekko kuhli]